MDSKKDNYSFIVIIINQLNKIIYYKLIFIFIDTVGFIKVIIDVVVRYHNFFGRLSPTKNHYLPENSSLYYAIFWH